MTSWRDNASAQCQSDLDERLDAALSFAQPRLATHGEFLPDSVAMGQNGQIAMIAGNTGSEKPPSVEVLAVLYAGLRTNADENRGAAVVADVRLRGEGTDAIQVQPSGG